MTRIAVRGNPILLALASLLLCTGAQAQESFAQIQASVSRWWIASETHTSLPASVWGVDLDATRWSGRRGSGGGLLLSPGVSGSVPVMWGLQLRGAMRSSSEAPSRWHPQVQISLGAGLLRFNEYIRYLTLVCSSIGGCKGDPDFRPGWVPWLSAAAGLDLPLPLGIGMRGQGALDIPVRGHASPGGGRWVYVRVGLGLTLRP